MGLGRWPLALLSPLDPMEMNAYLRVYASKESFALNLDPGSLVTGRLTGSGGYIWRFGTGEAC